MMEAVLARGRAAAAAARERAISDVAARAADALPGVTVDAGDEGLVLSGRGLARRLLHDGALRWIGSLMR